MAPTLLLLSPVARAARPAPAALAKSHPAARTPEVGDHIEFLSDGLTDKGPATGEVVGAKVTVDGLYVTVSFGDAQQSFSWDDLDAAGADVRGNLWMVKSHPVLFPGPTSRAQAEAGNFAKRRIAWNGLTLRVENEAGTIREGVGWSTRMLFPYGEVEDTVGLDGDRVDVYIGPALEDAPFVYVVHQRVYGDWTRHDEDKVMLGFLSEEEAAHAYLKHYDDPRFLGPITAMPVAEFVARCRGDEEVTRLGKSWFGDADLLKATLKKTITVPGYTKADGTVVPPHQKVVHYNPDHHFSDVAAGGVSHSQKQAHKKLSGEGWFQSLPLEDKAAHVMSHATDIQDAASASAAVSGWKAAALAGKNPSGAQWAAFNALPKEKQGALYDAVTAAGVGLAHLKPVGGAAPAVAPAKTPSAPAPKKAEGKAAPLADAGVGSKHAALLAEWMTSGAKGREDPDDKSFPLETAEEAIARRLHEAANSTAAYPQYKPGAFDYEIRNVPVSSIDGKHQGPDDIDEDSWKNTAKNIAAGKLAGLGRLHDVLPVLLADDNSLMDGYHRVAAAKANGETTIPALVPVKPGTGKVLNAAAYAKANAPAASSAQHEEAAAKLAAIPTSGSHYQKEAYKKLAADPGWQAKTPTEQHADLMALYKSLQGAASQAAAVSMWKKAMLAGKVPSGAQHAAYAALGTENPKKQAEVTQQVIDVIGAQKTIDLIHAAVQQHGADVNGPIAAGPKDGDTKPAADGGTLVLKDGHWQKQGGAAAAAPTAAVPFTPPLPLNWSFDPADQGFSGAPTIQAELPNGGGVYVSVNDEGGLQAGVLSVDGTPLHHEDFTDAKQAQYFLTGPMGTAYVPSVEALEHLMAEGPKAFPGKTAPRGVVPKGPDSVLLETVPFASTAGAFGIASTSAAVKQADKLLQAGDIPGAEALAASMPVAKKKTKAAVTAMVLKAKMIQKMPYAFGHDAGTIFDLSLSGAEVPPALWGKFAKQTENVKYSLFGAVMSATAGLPNEAATFKAIQTQFKEKGFAATPPHVASVKPAATPPAQPAPSSGKRVEVSAHVLHNTTEGHNKQWAVSTKGTQLITSYGAIGAKQQVTVKNFDTPLDAINAKNKLLKEKYAKGYEPTHGVIVGHKHSVGGAAPAAAPAAPAGALAPGWTKTDNGSLYFPALASATGAHGVSIYASKGKQGSFDVQSTNSAGEVTASHIGMAAEAVASLVSAKKELGTTLTAAQLKTFVSDGPKDGDTKQGADGLLVFKDGHWHKVAAGGASKKLSKAEADKVAKRALQVVGGGYMIGQNKATADQAKELATNADLPGLVKLKASIDPKKGGSPKLIAVVDALINALGGDASAAPHMGGSSVPPSKVASVKPAAAPAAAAPVAAPAKAPGTASSAMPKSKSGDPLEMKGWTQIGEKKGTNPGGSFKDKSGKVWYCKFPSSPDVARNEVLAAKFYQMLGLNVPNLKLVSKDGKVGIASAWVDGITKADSAKLAKADGALEGFVVDAWLGNWDVIGMSNDNLMIGKDGKAVRVDVGGSLVYRAQGGKKTDFGSEVKELESMLDPKINPQAAAVFKGITEKQKLAGARQLNKLKPSQIRELVDKIGPGNSKEKEQLTATLIARRTAILRQFKLADQWAKKSVDETSIPVNPAALPPPLDFQAMNSGKGLSSKAHVNAQNTKDSIALVSFAAKGNLKALKEYQYDAVDKESGADKGKKPITEHPSNQIQQQWASLVQTLQSIAYPPVEALDMPPLGLGGSLEEVAASAGSFGPQHNVTTVAAEHRFGYFMSLGHVDTDAASELAADLAKKEHYIPKISSNALIQQGKSHYAKGSALVKSYTAGVQGSGSVNHVWSQGKATWNGTSTKALAAKIYEEAFEVPEGMMMTRWMDDDTAADIMTDQLKKSGAGSILQNTDSMCASMWKEWQGHPHFCSEPKKAIMMKIRCAKGAKVTPSYGSGSHWDEGELTTLPGARFVVTAVKPGGPNHPNGIVVECIMLPPDPGFVAQLGGSPLTKALFFKGLTPCPPPTRTVLLLTRLLSPVRRAISATLKP